MGSRSVVKVNRSIRIPSLAKTGSSDSWEDHHERVLGITSKSAWFLATNHLSFLIKFLDGHVLSCIKFISAIQAAHDSGWPGDYSRKIVAYGTTIEMDCDSRKVQGTVRRLHARDVRSSPSMAVLVTP